MSLVEITVQVVPIVWKAVWDQVRVVNDTNQPIDVSVTATGFFESESYYHIGSGSSDTWSRSRRNGRVKVTIRWSGGSRSAWRDVGVIYASEILLT